MILAMKAIIAICLFILSGNIAHGAKMKFTYEPNELPASACEHEQIRDLPDWKVICKTPYETKEFVAHVIVRESQRKEEPQTFLEILYWVTERRPKQAPLFHSGTSMIRLKKGSSIESMRLSQSVENDYASLVMDWWPGSEADLASSGSRSISSLDK